MKGPQNEKIARAVAGEEFVPDEEREYQFFVPKNAYAVLEWSGNSCTTKYTSFLYAGVVAEVSWGVDLEVWFLFNSSMGISISFLWKISLRHGKSS